eukprot:s449_g4.t1
MTSATHHDEAMRRASSSQSFQGCSNFAPSFGIPSPPPTPKPVNEGLPGRVEGTKWDEGYRGRQCQRGAQLQSRSGTVSFGAARFGSTLMLVVLDCLSTDMKVVGLELAISKIHQVQIDYEEIIFSSFLSTGVSLQLHLCPLALSHFNPWPFRSIS